LNFRSNTHADGYEQRVPFNFTRAKYPTSSARSITWHWNLNRAVPPLRPAVSPMMAAGLTAQETNNVNLGIIAGSKRGMALSLRTSAQN
jgi:hypothetical protein